MEYYAAVKNWPNKATYDLIRSDFQKVLSGEKQNAQEYTPRMLYFEWEEEIRKHTHTCFSLYVCL